MWYRLKLQWYFSENDQCNSSLSKLAQSKKCFAFKIGNSTQSFPKSNHGIESFLLLSILGFLESLSCISCMAQKQQQQLLLQQPRNSDTKIQKGCVFVAFNNREMRKIMRSLFLQQNYFELNWCLSNRPLLYKHLITSYVADLPFLVF